MADALLEREMYPTCMTHVYTDRQGDRVSRDTPQTGDWIER